ncbi:hypothetical protein EGW08_015411 [Elysia chlorotica]|uniref:Uncharacterized protein n=1 Tax=Elysia chlorotica TaxID=188477 RepID=A0A433T5I3_ELYCH|nr:hypothetical protein EGW08_015411 [Elysia chlorotica]
MNDTSNNSVLELNVGGVFYSTNLGTLRREPDSLIARLFADHSNVKAVKDAKGKYFIDRDGVLFRYILDYLRNLKLVLPENFHEKDRLKQEAEFFSLPNLVKIIDASSTRKSRLGAGDESGLSPSPSPLGERGSGFITVGYRGTFAFGKEGLADVKFRKLTRIIVCGKVSLCKEVFKDTLNESRDPDRGDSDRYTSRFFLKHTFLEQAFDMLQDEGFALVASCGSGTNSAGELKPGLDTEEARWYHYNEFIFERR